MNGLTIGRLAKQVGIGIETVKFYERRNLIYLTAKWIVIVQNGQEIQLNY